MTNEQQTPEDKIKEYIERANSFIKKEYPQATRPDSPVILTIAQMLQREEHFNNHDILKEATEKINTLADDMAEATKKLKAEYEE